jgi:hypothetical protein
VRSTYGSIDHNTIAYNGNHGASIGGTSRIIIENSIVAFNERYGLKNEPEGGVAEMVSCVLYGNTLSLLRLPDGCIAADPGFVNARKMDFSLRTDSPCIARGTDRQDIGARLTAANGQRAPH